MHRSGTSALAGVLSLLGIPLGDEDDLMVGDESNQRGYWESRRLTDFQELLLRRFGGAWLSPPLFRAGWEDDPRLVREVGRARRIFRRLYGNSRLWAWKDPRTALLLPFWRRALQFRPLIAVIHRNPLEVARSLETRDGLPARKALSLWEAYNRAILANAAGLPALVLTYEGFVRKPAEGAGQIQAFLAANGVDVMKAPNDRVSEFVDAGLRHSTFEESDLRNDPNVTQSQLELVARLHALGGAHAALPG
jgi:hypothetical protein